MPLLNRDPFDKAPLPNDLRPDEEVFFCPLTGEVFRDYDDFFKRTILLNSLVWTCAATGRTNLTYEEALLSESTSRDLLETLPTSLARSLLFLCRLTQCSRLDDLVSDVYGYARNHFFVGEVVEVAFGMDKTVGVIVAVKYDQKSAIDEVSSILSGRNEVRSNVDENYIPVEIEDAFVGESSSRTSASGTTRYLVRVAVDLEEGASGSELKSYPVIEIPAVDVLRRNEVFTKQKCRFFLRGHCELSNGIWAVKKTSIDNLGVYNLSWTNIYAGPLPRFQPKAAFVLSRQRSSSDSDDLSSCSIFDDELQTSVHKKAVPCDRQRQSINALVEEARKYEIGVDDRLLEKLYGSGVVASDDDDICCIREQIKRAKDEEKERVRSLKRQEREALAEWKKVRDDLECDDHVPLPRLPSVDLPAGVSAESFGDCLSLVEFVNSFKEAVGLDDYFPQRVFTVDMVYDALFDGDVHGPFSRLCTMLLRRIFMLQEQEDGDEVELERKEDAQLENCELDNKYFRKYIEEATLLSQKIRKIHGASVRRLPVNSLTLSEALRLYFQTSGYYTGANTARFRYHSRGGYKCIDDQALFFRIEHSDLVERLSTECVYQFSPEERLRVALALRDHLLTFSVIRSILETKLDKIRSLRTDLRQIQLTEQRNDREALVAKMAAEARASSTAAAGLPAGEMPAAVTLPHQGPPSDESRDNARERVLNPDTLRLKKVLKALLEATEDATTEAVQIEYEMLENVSFEQLDAAEIDLVRKLQEQHAAMEETNLVSEIFELQGASGLILLGSDRAFRKYWLVKSAGTVFIEDYDQNMGCCDGATPLEKVTAVDISDPNPARRQLMVCSGCRATCVVHGVHHRKRWSFVGDEPQLQALIDALNPRGYREIELRENILFFRSVLSPLLQQFDARPFLMAASQLSWQPLASGVLEDHLRKDLLELEDRIYSHGLGVLKTPSRTSWRSAVQKCTHAADAKDRTAADNLVIDGKLVRAENFFVMALYQLASCVHERNFVLSADVEEGTKSSVAGENKGFLDLWKNSLLSVASISAVQLHLKTLEERISWDKSLSNVRCRACRRKGTATSFVVCCRCERPFHAKCAKSRRTHTSMAEFASGEWMCSRCSKHEGRCSRRKHQKGEGHLRRHRDLEPPNCKRPPTVMVNGNGISSVPVHKSQLTGLSDETESKAAMEDGSISCNNGRESSTESSNCDGPVCRVCRQLVISNRGHVACASCHTKVHLRCLGLKKVEQEWLCSVCSTRVKINHVLNQDGSEQSDRKRLKTSRSGRVIKKPRSLGEFDSRFNGMIKEEGCHDRSQEKRKSLTAAFVTHPRYSGDFIVDDWPVKNRPVARRSAYLPSEQTADEKCQELLRLLCGHDDAWPFLKPVAKRIAPDYYDVIKSPMDLRTIQYKLERHSYTVVHELVSDVTLMFDNCRTYNDPSAPVFQCGDRLEEYFRAKFVDLHLDEKESLLCRKRKQLSAPTPTS